MLANKIDRFAHTSHRPQYQQQQLNATRQHHHVQSNHVSNGSFARHAARAALAPNNNVVNVQPQSGAKVIKTTYVQQNEPNNNEEDESTEIDKIVESVTNATKRLSQISTNTNSSKRKSKNHVGPWRLGRTLGRGSTGRVRLAKHSETGQLAAVKIVPKSKFQKYGDQKGSSENSGDDQKDNSPYGIEREIIIMKLISHQNIMGLYDVWENKGELYLVLEYVEGGELFDYLIKKGKLPEKESIHYFRQIISGVSYCHQFNICHRDLKPENLLLDKNLNIKIADFGMAALELNQKLLETSCGSPHYASPEIVTGKTYHGSPSDVWSCGIILFALLTGHLPFDDENIRKLLMKVQSGRFVMPNYLSVEAKDLIWKMLKVNPNDRININDIMQHPLLKKYETSSTQKSKNTESVKLEHYYSEVDSLKLSKHDIDRDLLKSLSILFHGADESGLVSKLIQPESSPEKIFYYLLYKYKKQHQLKEKQQVTEKNSKKKLGNGDGTLKKSKSTIKTTITNQDGSSTCNITEVPVPVPVPTLAPTTPKSVKRIAKSPKGQIQIPVSSSYRRGVSFNNRQINAPELSRSSSRKSLASAAVVRSSASRTSTINPGIAKDPSIANIKKRQSILPPLPDLGVDWLNFGSQATSNSEFASLYEEIFNYKAPKKSSKSPSRSRSRSSSRKPSAKKQVSKKKSFTTSTPMGLKGEQQADLSNATVKINKSPSNEDTTETEIENENETQAQNQSLDHTPSKPLPRQLGNFEVNRRNVSEPAKRLSTIGGSTLDPKSKNRNISSDNADILNKLGVHLTRAKKTSSKIYYSKSSTSINLAAILKESGPSSVNKLALATSNVSSSDQHPLPQQMRVSSSNYGSFEEDTMSNATHELSFDFEVPTQTELATAIQISNGSNVTIGNKVKAREDSVFADIPGLATSMEETLNPSNSNNLIVRRHKKAFPTEQRQLKSHLVDIRSSLFNNPSDLKEDKPAAQHMPLLEFSHKRVPHGVASSDTDLDATVTQNSFMENSLFVDNQDEDSDYAHAKRVTMIFDDEDDEYGRFAEAGSYNTSLDTPVKKDIINDSPQDSFASSNDSPHKPLKSSPLKSIQQKHFIQSADGTMTKNAISLKPQRDAPTAPVPQSPVDSTKIKKSNWFTKFFSSLLSSPSNSGSTPSVKKQKAADVRVFKSSIPMKNLRRGIDSALELKKKEGTLTTLKRSGDIVTASIPASFALGKPLHFEIEFLDDEVILKKKKGSRKIFKNLIGAMEFVIDNETKRFNEST